MGIRVGYDRLVVERRRAKGFFVAVDQGMIIAREFQGVKVGEERKQPGLERSSQEEKRVGRDEQALTGPQSRDLSQVVPTPDGFEGGMDDEDMSSGGHDFRAGNEKNALASGVALELPVKGQSCVIGDRENLKAQLGGGVDELVGGIRDMVARILGRVDVKIRLQFFDGSKFILRIRPHHLASPRLFDGDDRKMDLSVSSK
jgi:hypothetical protein